MSRKDGFKVKLNVSDFFNACTFQETWEYLALLALTSVEIVNILPSMDERYLMETLFYSGQACLYNTEEFGIINAKCTPSGQLTIYNNSAYYEVITGGGVKVYNSVPNDENFVYIRANYFRKPVCEIVEYYAHKIYNIERTIDLNVDAQKMPFSIRTSEGQYLTVKNEFDKIQNFNPVIFKDKEINDSEIQVLNYEAPYIANDLFNLKMRYFNEFLTKIGINNTNTDKKERVITDEVNSNNEATSLSGAINIVELQKALEEANIKFGTDMYAKPREINLREIYLDDTLISSSTPFEEENEEIEGD